jgi:hypothetical protein
MIIQLQVKFLEAPKGRLPRCRLSWRGTSRVQWTNISNASFGYDLNAFDNGNMNLASGVLVTPPSNIWELHLSHHSLEKYTFILSYPLSHRCTAYPPHYEESSINLIFHNHVYASINAG